MPAWWFFVCIRCSVNVRYTLAVGIVIGVIVVAVAAAAAAIVAATVVVVVVGAAVKIGTDSMAGLKFDANGLLAVLHFIS